MAALAASIYGVDQFAKGYFGGRSVLAYISTSLIGGLRGIGTAIADGLTYMLEAVLNGNPNPSPPPAPAPPKAEPEQNTDERRTGVAERKATGVAERAQTGVAERQPREQQPDDGRYDVGRFGVYTVIA